MLVEAFQNHVDESIIKFKCVCKDNERLSSKLFITNQKLLICKQNQDVAKTLFSKFEMGLVC